MTRGFSLYLDALRFIAAIVVFASHMGYQRFTEGSMDWIRQLNLGSDAVIIFFVLSGFVIAHTTFTNARGPAAYAKARIARLYSVILPALAVTLLLDTIGASLFPAAYDGWWYSGDQIAAQYAHAVTFTTQLWHENIRVGTNGPFWSVAYEAWYYAGFGVAVFCRGRTRWVILGLMALVAGPRILLLAPCWMLGVALQQMIVRGITGHVSRRTAWILTLAPWLIYTTALAIRLPETLQVITYFLLGGTYPNAALGFSDEFIWNFLIAILVALHFLGVYRLSREAVWIGPRAASAIRWCAGATFSIYLFHYPIMTLLHALPHYDGTVPLHQAMLAAATLAACFVLAEVSERRLGVWRKIIDGIFQRADLAWRAARPVMSGP